MRGGTDSAGSEPQAERHASGLRGKNFLERACWSLDAVALPRTPPPDSCRPRAARPLRMESLAGLGSSGCRPASIARPGVQALNITQERISQVLRKHNLSHQQFIALYGLWSLFHTPEMPVCTKLHTWVLIFALVLSSNATVVYMVTSSKAMRTVTNIFICSLALSDLLIAFFCIPVRMLQNISDNG